jgi:hypothetical protein
VSDAMSLGAALRRLTVAHAIVGLVVYRRELRGIVREGLVGTVPYRSERAAALWFIGSTLPGWLVGRLVDAAAAAGDRREVQLAGSVGLVAALVGAVAMPVSTFWLQAAVCVRMLRGASRLSDRHG